MSKLCLWREESAVKRNGRVRTVTLNTNVQSLWALSLSRTYSVGRTDGYPETNSNRDLSGLAFVNSSILLILIYIVGVENPVVLVVPSTIECLINLKTRKDPTITGVNLNLRTNEGNGTATNWRGPWFDFRAQQLHF